MSSKPLCCTDGGEPWKDSERMLKLHVEQDYTYAEMADVLGCSQSTVNYWMKRHRADELAKGLDLDIPDEKPYKSQELMEQLYVEEQLSSTDISAILDCSNATVINWLEKHGIGTRSRSDAMSVARGGEKGLYSWTNKAYGYEVFKSGRKDSFYHHRLLAVAEYGFEAVKGMDVHHEKGLSWDNRPDNLQLLTPSAHQRTENGYNWHDEIRSVEMYREGLSSYDISGVIGCSPGTVISWVRSFDEDLVRNGGAA